MINNGKGAEFRNYGHPCYFLGEEADSFIAASGHFGNKSQELVKHYATDLGFEYISVRNKQEFLAEVDKFVDPNDRDRPILMEAFVNSKDESEALKILLNSAKEEESFATKMKSTAKTVIKDVLGNNTVNKIKTVLGK